MYEFAVPIELKEEEMLIYQTNDFLTGTPNNLPILQTLLLTDIFGKLRATREHFDGVQLDMLLANVCALVNLLNNY